jgi:hypothetical protein
MHEGQNYKSPIILLFHECPLLASSARDNPSRCVAFSAKLLPHAGIPVTPATPGAIGEALEAAGAE